MRKTIYIALAAVIVIAAAYSLFRIDPESAGQSLDGQMATFRDAELGLEFRYRTGPNGYAIQESSPSSTDKDLMRSVVVIRQEDIGEAPEGGEGAPTMTIYVFRNARGQQPLEWAESHVQYSNINLKMGDIASTTVGGAEGIRYMADGLYASDNAVVASGDKIYVFSGMFLDQDSDLRRDFEPLLSSVRFISEPQPE